MLSGTIGAFSAAFGVTLTRYEHPSGPYRGRTGAVQVPEELGPVVLAVLGLDDRPQSTPKFRIHKPAEGTVVSARAAASAGFTPPQLARLYDFPTGLDGSGECIAIIELGGGFKNDDLKAYFAQLNIPLPPVTAVAVDGAHNAPTGIQTARTGR